MSDETRVMTTMRLPEKTREALRKKASALGTSQANALGVALGVEPASAYAKSEKSNGGKLVTR